MNFSEFEEGQKSGFFLDFANLLLADEYWLMVDD
jgi:hypothetical protein